MFVRKKREIFFFVVATFVIAILFSSRDSFAATKAPGVARVGNAAVERVISVAGGRLGTVEIANKRTGAKLKTAEEFAFTLMDGKRVSSKNFSCGAPERNKEGVTVLCRNEELRIDARVSYSAPKDKPW
ncbi:MAG TPA: hypothetical protein PLQ76_00775, partial [bacterium]|nr:hypothetical protein [bacterium]